MDIPDHISCKQTYENMSENPETQEKHINKLSKPFICHNNEFTIFSNNIRIPRGFDRQFVELAENWSMKVSVLSIFRLFTNHLTA